MIVVTMYYTRIIQGKCKHLLQGQGQHWKRKRVVSLKALLGENGSDSFQ